MGKIPSGESYNTGYGRCLSYGNKKMTIPLFSLPSGKTCKGKTPLCSKMCYAKKAERLYPQVLPFREANYQLSLTDDFTNVMVDELNSDKLIFMPFVRVHESGDFYSQEYLEKWYEIAKRVSNKTFLAFTKNYSLDFSKRPKNLIIYFSIWIDTNLEGVKIPRGIKKAYTRLDIGIRNKKGSWTRKPIYDYPVLNTGKAIECKGFCDRCLVCFQNKSNVYFPVH